MNIFNARGLSVLLGTAMLLNKIPIKNANYIIKVVFLLIIFKLYFNLYY